MKSEFQLCEDLYSRHLRKFGYQLPYIKKTVRDIRVKSLAKSLWLKRGNLTFYSKDGEHALKNEIMKKIIFSSCWIFWISKRSSAIQDFWINELPFIWSTLNFNLLYNNYLKILIVHIFCFSYFYRKIFLTTLNCSNVTKIRPFISIL